MAVLEWLGVFALADLVLSLSCMGTLPQAVITSAEPRGRQGQPAPEGSVPQPERLSVHQKLKLRSKGLTSGRSTATT